MGSRNWYIEPYDINEAPEWDAFVSRSRNATFLLKRRYMDYHSDRFDDCSLRAVKDGKILALLPANRKGNELFSHGGLTYGGWILPEDKVDGSDMVEIFEAWLNWCRGEGIAAIHYKPIPYIYARCPAQEDLFALWRYGAEREKVMLSSVIDMADAPGFDYRRRRYLNRVAQENVKTGVSDDLDSFMQILTECLYQRHAAVPVHSACEIRQLQASFPKEITLYALSDEEGMQAGVLMFRTPKTYHCQYIATTERARSKRYLPYLVQKMLTECDARYFDFGTSNNPEDARLLNVGLLNQKFGFGASGVAYEQYILKL